MAYDPAVFNVDPYYDDYDDNKKFLRVLYKPGYAVQARELTQTQTILQNQVKRFGDHIFKDGSPVTESQVTSVKGRFVRVGSLTGYSGVSINDFDGLTATVAGINTVKITAVLSGLSGSNKDTSSILFFPEYLAGPTGFTAGHVLSSNYNGTTITATVTGGTAGYNDYSMAPNNLPFSGDAYLLGIDSGVRFIKGYFVNHDAQKLMLYSFTGTSPNTYRNFQTINTSVYFDVTDTIVSSVDDDSLNDPAYGSYNYAAPGADRYRLDLTLKQSNDGQGTTSEYVIAKYENSLLSYISNRPKYNILADEMARRTYDESGNYTVDDFQIFVQDLTSDESTVQINVGPGKAYVFGYEFVNPYNKGLTTSKAREYRVMDAAIDVPFIIGSSISVTGNASLTANIYDKVQWNNYPFVYLSSGSSGAFSKIGTARIGKYEVVENTKRIHLYDVKIDSGYDPATAQRIFYPGYTGSDEHFLKFTDGYLNIFNPSYTSLIFPFSEDGSSYAVRKIDGHDYAIQRSTVINTGAGSGSINLSSFAVGSEFAALSPCEFRSENDVKFFSLTGAPISVGSVVLASLNQRVDYSGAPAGITAVVFAAVEVQDNGGVGYTRSKTSVNETASVIMRDNGYEKFAYLNGNVDVYQILSITGNTGGASFNMTNYFTLDPGYRDDIYDWSRIVLDRRYNTAGVTGVSVTYKKYQHANSCLPYSLSSYGNVSSLGLDPGGTGAGYRDVPVHAFAAQRGSRIFLGSCLDTRPDRITPSSFSGATSNPFDYGATGGCHLIGSSFQMQWTYFLPRTDKLILTRDQQFKLITGVSNEKAEVPPDADDAMTLATFSFKPYTESYKDVQTFIAKNRRYTMRDIGVIDKKLSRVEYYTTLSLLEKDAKSLEIQDENGLNKYKNGIFVDDFTSRTNSDINNPDQKSAIDPVRQEARPKFITKYADLSLTGSIPSGITFAANGMAMCNYTQAIFQEQPKAARAINVNPYSVVNYLGRITLTPQTDDWIDVETRPDLVVKIDNAQGVAENEIVDIGTVWDEWQTTWTGTPVPVAGVAGQWTAIRTWTGANAAGTAGTWTESTRQVQTDFRQVRAGTRNTLVAEETSRYLGKRVVDTSIIPYMRAVNIGFKGDGFRPNVRVYPFFDNTPISNFISINGVTSAAPLITDSSGRIGYDQTLVFNCPSGVYRTGDRSFRLIDEPNNNIYLSTTNGESHFGSSGLKRVEEGTTLSVRDLTLRRQSVTEEQSGTLLSNQNVTTFTVRSHDPVAQTFFVDPVMYPSGIFLKKIDLYFKTKSSTIPVRIEMRPTLNGYPRSNQILGFGVVSLLPNQVNISEDATTPTSFEFENPVYIQPGECSMCVLSNSNDYEVWVSEMGLDDITTGERITVQPSLGSFFKSQNASTWTAEQMMDLKFTMHRCVFDTSGGTLTFKYNENDFDVESSGIDNGVNLWHFNNTTVTPARTAITYTTEFESDPGIEYPTQVRTNLQFPMKKSVANGSEDTITVRSTLITDNENVSPAIDLERFSGLYVQNILNSFRTDDPAIQEANEKLPSVGGISADSCAAFRYFTRKINLQDGFESDEVDVFLDARLPQYGEIKVYMRSQAPFDSTPFRDIPFELMSVHPDYTNKITANYVPQFVSVGEDDYVDLRFTRGATGASGPRCTSGISGQSTFKNVQVKIVMYGDPDNSTVPAFKNFRVITT